MKVYLDDNRETPEGYFRVYSAPHAIELLEERLKKALPVEEISLDHDLGACSDCVLEHRDLHPTDPRELSECEHIGNGNDVLLWIEEQACTNKHYVPPVVLVHSQNSGAVPKMKLGAAKVNHIRQQRLQTEQ